MKTLYLSDLDGTLLRSNERVSSYTAGIINRFIENGGYFTYATARNADSAVAVTDGIDIKLPMIVSDGVFIIDAAQNKLCQANYLTTDEVMSIYKYLNTRGTSPIVFARIDEALRFSYIERLVTPATKRFIDNRIGDPRRRSVTTDEELFHGDIYRIIWTPSTPDSIANEENLFKHFSRRDYHPQDDLCDILSNRATKANAALQLKAITGCDRLAAFGDDYNDLPLFAIADEKYAMSNAIPAIKKAATAVIDSNDNDGVAKWIEENQL